MGEPTFPCNGQTPEQPTLCYMSSTWARRLTKKASETTIEASDHHHSEIRRSRRTNSRKCGRDSERRNHLAATRIQQSQACPSFAKGGTLQNLRRANRQIGFAILLHSMPRLYAGDGKSISPLSGGMLYRVSATCCCCSE